MSDIYGDNQFDLWAGWSWILHLHHKECSLSEETAEVFIGSALMGFGAMSFLLWQKYVTTR